MVDSQKLRAHMSDAPSEATHAIGTVTLEITHRCHRRCAFCYVSGLSDRESSSGEELDAEPLCSMARKIVLATGCRHVQLSGGEPLLRRDLLQIVDGVKETGARVSIITDGAALDESLAHGLAGRGVGMVQPTLLAGDARLHDSLRGAGAFRGATRAIATAASAGLNVSVCMVVTRLNYGEAGRVAELAFALGARGLALSRFCPTGPAAAAFGSLMPDATQVRTAAEAASTACSSLGLPLAAAVTIPRCVWKDPERPPLAVGVCSLVGPKSTMTVGPDGSLRTCCMSSRSVGNILNEPWEVLVDRLWNQEVLPFREDRPEKCRACQHWSRCRGGCRLSAEAVFGSRNEQDPLAPTADLELTRRFTHE